MQNTTPALQSLSTVNEYHETRVAHLFPTVDSLRWYIRLNRAELVEAGALVRITRRWFAHADRFDAFVLENAQRSAVLKLQQ